MRSCDNALGNDARTLPIMFDKNCVVRRAEDADKVCLATPTSLLNRFHSPGIMGMFRLPDVCDIHRWSLLDTATCDLTQMPVTGDGVAPLFHGRNKLLGTLDLQSARKKNRSAQDYHSVMANRPSKFFISSHLRSRRLPSGKRSILATDI